MPIRKNKSVAYNTVGPVWVIIAPSGPCRWSLSRIMITTPLGPYRWSLSRTMITAPSGPYRPLFHTVSTMPSGPYRPLFRTVSTAPSGPYSFLYQLLSFRHARNIKQIISICKWFKNDKVQDMT